MIEIKDLVLHPIQLIGVEIINCELRKFATAFEEINLDDLGVNLKSWSELDTEKNEIGYTYLRLTIDFKGKNNPFFVDITYRGVCLLDSEEFNSGQYMNFLEAQGLKLLWPYIKPALADFMVKMNIDPLKLPTLDVLKTMENSNYGKEVK